MAVVAATMLAMILVLAFAPSDLDPAIWPGLRLFAGTAIAGWQKGATALATGVPLLIFALPIADVVSTVARRGLSRPAHGRLTLSAAVQRVFEPDRQHIHHRLLALGWSPRRTAVILYGVTGVLSLLSLATAQTP